ncbi:hypothetical protein [Thalassobacillus hwangdonensis]|uniref:Uncharacterized protein n=1 Tax=Thalassobacillus hwangdonensis TaxID=546108 RepID=A0ABW3L374_9BACI
MRSLKTQMTLAIATALLFVAGSFYYVEFSGKEEFLPIRMIFYFVMISSVFNAGLLTQKYIGARN